MMESVRVLVKVICVLAVAAAQLTIDVEYPDGTSNRNRVKLTCRRPLLPFPGAQFQKDGAPLTQGPGRDQVTSLTNEGNGEVIFTFTQAQEGFFRCVGNDEMSDEVGLAAAPDTNYDNLPPRRRYVVFSNRSSTRDIVLSCPIRPRALNDSYSVVWQASSAEGGFITLEDSEDKYDLPVNVNSSSERNYQCIVFIQHRSDRVASTEDYDGPQIIIERLVLATIDSDIQNVNITEEERANFTCNFSKGGRDIDDITVYWTVDGGQYDCVTAEEDIRPNSNGCFTTETQSVLLIRNTSSFTLGSHQVQCILQQNNNIPQEFRDDSSFNVMFNNIIRTASLTIRPTVSTVSPTPTLTPSPNPPSSSSIVIAAGAAAGASVAVIIAVIVLIVVVIVCCCCMRKNTDPEAKGTRCFKWRPNRDVENGGIPIVEIPPSSGHVSPSKRFHSKNTPEYLRQNAQNGARKNSLDLPEEPFYNGGSMISAASGISALSDESMSCPPSPAVSDYPGFEGGENIQHGPSISVDDGDELFSYSDRQFEGSGAHDYHPSDQACYHHVDDLHNSHKYAPSQASSFGMHNLFEGQSLQGGYAETGYGSQQDVQCHRSCDPLCSLDVPHYDNRTGSASSVRSDRTHSTRHSKGSSRSGKSSRSGRSDRLEVEHDHRYPATTSPHEERHRRHSPSSRNHECHGDHDHHRSRSGSPHSRSPRRTADRPIYMREPSQLSSNGPQYHSHYVLPNDPQPSAVPMRPTRSAEWARPSNIPLHHNGVGNSNGPPPLDRTHHSNEPDGSEIGDMMLMAIGCLMHQEDCQIPKCPCKEVKERFQHLLPQTRLHRQKEAEKVVDEAQRGDFDPTDRRQQLRISLSSQNFNKDIHAHYHMTSRSHIRSSDGRKLIIQRRRSRSMDLTPVAEQPEEPCATTPSVVLPEGARGLLCGPTVFSPAVTPAGEKLRVLSPSTPSASSIAPPVLLREISLSADNLPALCLNDCPIAATPLMQMSNRTLGSAMPSPLATNQHRWSSGSAGEQREPVMKEKVGHQKDSPSSDEGHTTEHERFTSQDSSSSLQTTSTNSSGQSGKSEGTSVLGESSPKKHVFDAQTSTSTTSTDMDDSMRRRQFQIWGKQDEITRSPDETMRLDSGYGTSGDATDVEGSLPKPRAPPGNLPLTPPKVPAKQKHVVPVDQPKHLAPINRRGSTSSYGSHTSHLSVASAGSHVSQGSDGSITTQTLC